MSKAFEVTNIELKSKLSTPDCKVSQEDVQSITAFSPNLAVLKDILTVLSGEMSSWVIEREKRSM